MPATWRWRSGSRAAGSTSSSAPATCTCCVRRSSTGSRSVWSTCIRHRCRSFPGAHPLEDVLAAGAPAAAATVHYVDSGVDTGEVIASESVPVLAGDTVETLRERVHAAEHRLLPKVVRELCAR